MPKAPPRGVVPCVVSERWIEFPPKSGGRYDFGEPIEISIKTRGSNDKPRKLCELIVTREDLLRAIKQVQVPSKPETNGRY
jgi:hypothetical protein